MQFIYCRGTLRNVVYYSIFKHKLPERDYDLIFIGKNKDNFMKNLKNNDFSYGKIKRKNQLVVKKQKILKPQNINDYVVLDIQFEKTKNIKEILKKKIDFTINGFALPLRQFGKDKWKNKLITLPNALVDMKKKQIILNKYKIKPHGTELFACLRLMSIGFNKPTKEEIQKLINILSKLPKNRFKRNVKKVFNYVGGEEKARKLYRELDINIDIFNPKVIKKLRKTIEN